MAHQEITVGLRFTADTAAARNQLNGLKQDLNNLANFTNFNIGGNLSESLLEASNAAAQLKVQLESATNIKTGNLDLSKFNYSLKQSGMTLEQYKKSLFSLGPDGEKAFFQLTSSIQSAEIPLLRINKLFAGLWENLKRTAGWQFSSSAIHAFMGAMKSAYGYAQDLNRSLNDIRIVTGQNNEQMAKFAEIANRSAQALSTSTNEYVKASLIYYQQGLSDSEVQARTDVTVKMANVTRESAETVSDQMTAVWNNFAKGGENLESFADKMVALGAATASSSDEIAQGLEKFSGVANTIGLSFDYAAAALTTITATTRMSADTVGTALKTLFSRLESLKLGDTLDDGTDLTKYSAALETVGVNIKDSSGELKKMDQIIDETMNKWKTLSKDQQVALAQTVAGQRQYTQFVTLMDNADFFKENLATEAGSSGALQEQADIYAESWEAAQKRVKAATESIYQDLLDDKFFIKITNNFAKILNGVDKFIDSLGGLKGILPGIAALILKIGGDKIAANIERSAHSLRTLITGGAAEKALKNQAAQLTIMAVGDNETEEEKAQGAYYSAIAKSQQALIERAPKMSQEELKLNEILLDRIKTLGQINIERAKALDLAKEEENSSKASLDVLNKRTFGIGAWDGLKKKTDFQTSFSTSDKVAQNKLDEINSFLGTDLTAGFDESISATDKFRMVAMTAFEKIKESIQNSKKDIESYAQELGELKAQWDELSGAEQNLKNLQKAGASAKDIAEAEEEVAGLRKSFGELKDIEENINNTQSKLEDSAQKIGKGYGVLGKNVEKTEEKVLAYAGAIEKKIRADRSSMRSNENLDKGLHKYMASLDEAKAKITTYANAMVKGAQSISSILMALNGLKSVMDTLADPDISSWEKVTSIMMSLSMAIPGIITGLSGLADTMSKISAAGGIGGLFQGITSGLGALQGNILNSSGAIGALTSSLLANNEAMQAGNVLRGISNALIKAGEEANVKDIATKQLKNALDKGELTTQGLLNIANKLGAEITEDNTDATIESIAAKLAEAGASTVDGAAKTGEAAATKAAGVANSFFLSTLLPLLPIILAVVAAIAVLTVGIYALVKAYNKENDALKEANENLSEATKAASEAKEEYDSLKQKIDDLNSAKDTLKGLEEGTTEWTEAVANLNSKMLELIDLYPELGKFLSVNEKGIYELSEEGEQALVDLQKDKLKHLQSAQLDEISARAGVQEATSKKVTNDSAKEINSNKTEQGAWWTGGLGVAALGSLLIPVVGPYIAAMLGSATLMSGLGTLTANNNDNKLEEGLYKIAEELAKDESLTQEDINSLLDSGKDSLGRTLEDYINQSGLSSASMSALQNGLEQNREATEKAIGAILENTQSQLAENQLLGKEMATNYIKDEYSDEIKSGLEARGLKADETSINSIAAIVAATQQKEYTKNYEAEKKDKDKKLSNADLSNYLGSTIKNNEDLALKYVAARYGVNTSDAKYKDGIVTINDKQYTVNNETARNFLYDQEAIKKAQSKTETSENIGKTINDLLDANKSATELGKRYGADFVSALNESLQNVNKEGKIDLSNVLLEMSPEEMDDLWGEGDPEKIAQRLGVTDELVQEFGDAGFNSAKEFGEAMMEEMGHYSYAAYLEHEKEKMRAYAAEAAEAYGLDKDIIEAQANEIQKVNEDLGISAEQAARLAVANQRLNKGVTTLNKSFADWKTSLTTLDRTSQDYAEAVAGVNETLKDLLNLSDDFDIPAGFLDTPGILDEIEKAAQGDEVAINNVGIAMANASIDALTLDYAMAAAFEEEYEIKLNEESFNETKNIVLAGIQDIQNNMQGLLDGSVGIGDVVGEDWINAVNKMALATNMTVDQMNSMLGSLGVQAKVDVKEVEQDMTVPTYTEYEEQVGEKTSKWYDEDGKEKFSTRPIWKKYSVPGPSEHVKGYVQVAQISTEKNPLTPNISFTGVGGTANRGSVNRGGGVSPKSTSAGKDKSGSGSGSGKEITPKKAGDEIDRYHEVNEVLDDLSKKMDELSTLKDRAWGGKRISMIQAERQALEEYGNTLNQKLAQAEAYLQSDAAYLNAYGAIYDEMGRVTNYNQIIENAVAAYNSGAIEDEEYNDIKKKLENYENSLNTRQDLLYEQAENARKILDSKFEEVEYTIEINVEIDDRKIEYLEWLIKHLEDQPFNQAETIATLSQNFDNMTNKWNDYTKGIHDILATAGASETDISNYINGNVDGIAALDNLTEQAKEDLDEYTEGLRDTYDSLIDLKKTVEDQLQSVWDEWNEKIEHQMDLLDHYDSIIGHYKNIVDIIGAKPLGMTSENLIKLAKAQVEAGVKTTEAMRSNVERIEKDLEAARQELARASTAEDRKYWEDQIRELESSWTNANENFYSTWEDTVQRAADLYDTTLTQAIKDFEDSISSSFKTFEEAQELFDQQKTLADQYVPEYKKLYELSKLYRSLSQDLEKAQGESARKKLLDLQDEINEKLKEGVQLSEYDLEYLQKKYNLRLAEIALEEAQNAKNKVRLRRDSNGNYNYVYTSDDDKVEDQIQNYEDKLFEIQDLTENYLNELSEAYIQTMAEMTQALANIRREDYASEEEYMAKVDQVKTYYTTRLQYYSNEINKALQNNQQLYLEDKLFTDNIYSEKELRQRAFVTDFHNTLVGGLMTEYDNIDDVTTTLVNHLGAPGQSGTLIGTMCDNWHNWHETTDEILKLNETSIETFADDLDEKIWGSGGIDDNVEGMKDGILERMEETKNSIDDMARNASEDFANTARAIGNFQAETSPRLQKLKEDTIAYTEAHLRLLEALAKKIEDPKNVSTNTVVNITKNVTEDSYSKKTDGGGNVIPADKTGDKTGDKPTNKTVPPKATDIMTGHWILDAERKNKNAKFDYKEVGVFVSEEEAKKAKKSIELSDNRNLHNYKFIISYSASPLKLYNNSKSILAALQTGGYTGAWGPDGRLAVLHEKELVLNKQDTSNMLQAVNIVRDIAKKIDLNVQTGGRISLDKLNENLGITRSRTSIGYNKSNNKDLENKQNITIYADFPGVSVEGEIQRAFDDLAMQAVQYAYNETGF